MLAPLYLADTLTVEYCVYRHPDRSNKDVMAELDETIARAPASDLWLRTHLPVV